jgi:V/A-type H+-transporting ATPase subunit A
MGSLVLAKGLAQPRMHDLVRIGERRLIGEIIRLEGEVASVQVYEDTTGLRVGEMVETNGRPLTVELGPGLLGGVFDGIQRPLRELENASGPFISAGAALAALDRHRAWDFQPLVRAGDAVKPGMPLGAVDENGFRHLVLCPPHVSGNATSVFTGAATIEDPLVTLEDGSSIAMRQDWPVRLARPHRGKVKAEKPLLTGQRVFDTFYPVAQGGAVIVPGGFGTGKTVVEHLLARYSNVDIIVYVGCGERGNEMTTLLAEFPGLTDPRTGRPLMSRTVLIANTSNMPVAAREASIYVGMSIAEYFRDMGYAVAVMADSTSRWAEALREISSRLGEMPGEEGYPPYLSSRLASYYERAGEVRCLGPGERSGSVTVVSAVSPPGGDYSEPVTQASLRVAGAVWALDARLAQRRHFPAVSWTDSYSLYVDALAEWFARATQPDWAELRLKAMRLLQKEEELQQIVQIVGADALPDEERLALEAARQLREGFLQQNGYHPVDACCPVQRQVASLRLFLEWVDRCRESLRSGDSLEQIVVAPEWTLLRQLREAPNDQFQQQVEILEAGLRPASDI